ncbi:MAG: exodeoxyribonuclease VII large subunit [Acidimicrobiaceae bacterium]|nr:exodeoxyribonuclease VII large subunit [Acidimicrobiaceae bacterium]
MSLRESDPVILDVGQFYDVLEAHLEESFGKRHPLWVRGEITKVYEKGHLYLDLAGSLRSDGKRPTLNAHCWTSVWGRLKASLAAEGVRLSEGAVVSVHGFVDLYAPSGRIGFTVTGLDLNGLVGDLARRRAELIQRLGAEGLLEAQRARVLSPVPLRVGLVASPGTEGYNDFTGQLLTSRYGFDVRLVRSLVQGDEAPAQIVRALQQLGDENCDVICVVRGGGSRADLACFDDERVARAIATLSTPVWTGIGHTGDESVADLVAHTRAITPTKLGEELVTRVREAELRGVLQPAGALLTGASAVLEEAETTLAERRRTLVYAVRDRLRGESRHLNGVRERLVVESRRVLDGARRDLETRRQLLGAYDPARRFAQGWAVVVGESGRAVTSTTEVAVGEPLRVRVGDGAFGVVVSERDDA